MYRAKGSFMLFTALKKLSISLPVLMIIGVVAGKFLPIKSNPLDESQSYIVSAKDYKTLNNKLDEFGLHPTHQLSIINAVAVDLTKSELTKLETEVSLKATLNYKVKLTNNGWRKGQRRFQPSAVIVDYIGASSAHYNYNFGDDVTIGFLDTGLDQLEGLSTDLYGGTRHGGIMMRLIIVYIIMMMRLMGMVHM
jgi:serine protease AprX